MIADLVVGAIAVGVFVVIVLAAVSGNAGDETEYVKDYNKESK